LFVTADHHVERTAELHLLCAGYLGRADDRVGSTVTFVRDGDLRLVIDPGMVASPAAILDPLTALGVEPDDVTDVVFSHHHPDHTLNAALFPTARFHDHWAVYEADLWTSRPAEGVQLAPSVRLIETPGHTPQDITTLVGTADGVVALTHLWWTADGPVEDPTAVDPESLHANRRRVLGIPGLALIVPGHGEAFAPTAATPR
jgi:glyoxylase-like metal-dependent hydrolase (beta-lactamase superfamily II)